MYINHREVIAQVAESIAYCPRSLIIYANDNQTSKNPFESLRRNQRANFTGLRRLHLTLVLASAFD